MFDIFHRNFGFRDDPRPEEPDPSLERVDKIAVVALVIVTLVIVAFGIAIA